MHVESVRELRRGCKNLNFNGQNFFVMKGNRVLISIIGDPSRYRQGKYSFRGVQGLYYMSSQILDQKLKPTHKVLIAGMSLLKNSQGSKCNDYASCSQISLVAK